MFLVFWWRIKVTQCWCKTEKKNRSHYSTISPPTTWDEEWSRKAPPPALEIGGGSADSAKRDRRKGARAITLLRSRMWESARTKQRDRVEVGNQFWEKITVNRKKCEECGKLNPTRFSRPVSLGKLVALRISSDKMGLHADFQDYDASLCS